MGKNEVVTSQRSRGRDWLMLPVKIVLGIWLFWIVAANLFLNTPAATWAINRSPERWSVTWESAWTPYPAQVFVKNAVYEQKTQKMGIKVTGESVKARIRVLPFLEKTFRADGIVGEGFVVELDRSGGSGLPPKPKEGKPPGFKIELLGIDLEAIQQFRFDELLVAGGKSKLTGDFLMQVRSDMVIHDVDLAWRKTQVFLKGEGDDEDVDIEFRGGFEPFNPKVDKGMAALGHLTAEIEVDGRVASLAPLKIFFANTKWIERLDGSGDVQLDLEVEQGRIADGSGLRVVADELLVDFMGFRAQGSGRVEGAVSAGDEGRDAHVAVLFDEFSYRRQSQEDPLAFGTGLRLETRADNLDREELAEALTVTLDLPSSEVPDVSFLGAFLPETLELSLTGGSAALKAHLEASGADEVATGSFELRCQDLTGGFKDFDFEIDLDVSTQLSGSDWDDFEVLLSGTEVRLSDGVFSHPEVDQVDGWWMSVRIPEGKANLAVPFELNAEIELGMRDTRVLVAFFTEIENWIRHFDGLLTIEDVEGSARAALSDERLSLRGLSLQGHRLEALGELEMEKVDSAAVFWAKFGILSMALESRGTQTEWKMIKPRKWYEERLAESWISEQGETLVPELERVEVEQGDGEPSDK